MRCPECGDTRTRALNARNVRAFKRRTRECLNCDHAWTTHEINLDAETMKKLHPNNIHAYRVGRYFRDLWNRDQEALTHFIMGWESEDV